MNLTKRKLVVGAAVTAMLAGAVGAFAFFTSTGKGDGSGTTGSATVFTVAVSNTVTPVLLPDASPGAGPNIETVSYTVTNAGAGFQKVSTVHIAIANNDGSAFISPTANFPLEDACVAADYSLEGNATSSSAAGINDPDFTAVDLAPGASTSGSITLEMIDDTTAQDNCQGVTVPIHVTVS